jgi:hypothetical protein
VKRLCADDSAATSVKVGYRQASYKEKTRSAMSGFFFVSSFMCVVLPVFFYLISCSGPPQRRNSPERLTMSNAGPNATPISALSILVADNRTVLHLRRVTTLPQ